MTLEINKQHNLLSAPLEMLNNIKKLQQDKIKQKQYIFELDNLFKKIKSIG